MSPIIIINPNRIIFKLIDIICRNHKAFDVVEYNLLVNSIVNKEIEF